jgi:hypothetical protein
MEEAAGEAIRKEREAIASLVQLPLQTNGNHRYWEVVRLLASSSILLFMVLDKPKGNKKTPFPWP